MVLQQSHVKQMLAAVKHITDCSFCLFTGQCIDATGDLHSPTALVQNLTLDCLIPK